jgi:hypothetical protein
MNTPVQPRRPQPAPGTAPTAPPPHREAGPRFQQALDRAATANNTATPAAPEAQAEGGRAPAEEGHAQRRSRPGQRARRPPAPPQAALSPTPQERDTASPRPPHHGDAPAAPEALALGPAAKRAAGRTDGPQTQPTQAHHHAGPTAGDAQRRLLALAGPAHLSGWPNFAAGTGPATHWQVQLQVQPPGTAAADRQPATLWVQAPAAGAGPCAGLQLQLCAPASQLLAPSLQALQQRLAQRGHHLVAQAFDGPDDAPTQPRAAHRAHAPTTSALDAPEPEPWP